MGMNETRIEAMLGSASVKKLEENRAKCADIDDLLSMEGLPEATAKKLLDKKAELEKESKELVAESMREHDMLFVTA